MPSLSSLVPLRNRGYRRVWTGQLLSAAGDGIFQVALISDVLHARGPGRRSELGFVLAADSVGLLVVLLLGGVLADRMPRSRLMIIANLLQAGAVVAFALTGPTAPLAVLVGLALVVGVGIGLFYPAYQALLPSFLERELLQPGNALQSLATSTAGVDRTNAWRSGCDHRRLATGGVFHRRCQFCDLRDVSRRRAAAGPTSR